MKRQCCLGCSLNLPRIFQLSFQIGYSPFKFRDFVEYLGKLDDFDEWKTHDLQIESQQAIVGEGETLRLVEHHQRVNNLSAWIALEFIWHSVVGDVSRKQLVRDKGVGLDDDVTVGEFGPEVVSLGGTVDLLFDVSHQLIRYLHIFCHVRIIDATAALDILCEHPNKRSISC